MSEAISLEQFAQSLTEASEGQPETPEPEQVEADQAAEGQPEAEAQVEEEAQADPETEAEQEEQPPEESSDDQVIKWQTANGETYEVPVSELKQGYMRDADYRQKTQTLAEERRQAEQTIQQKFTEAETFAADLAKLHSTAEQIKQYEALDWENLEQQDPTQAMRLWRQYQQLKDSASRLAHEFQEKQQQNEQQRRQAFLQATKEAEEHLKKVIPNFGPQALQQMREYGLKEGFTAEELANTADKRHLTALWKAAQWDALQAKKPETVKALAKVPAKAPPSKQAPTKHEQVLKQASNKKAFTVNEFAALLKASR